MRYTLTWCPELAIYRLIRPDGVRETLTDSELLERIGDNEVLRQWVEFTTDHPNQPVDYDMIPA